MLEIYDYSDYRQFLKDYYESHKAVNPNFSFRYLAQKAGINSSGYYKLVIDGKRNLTRATILKTCAALKLDDREAEYFENLVLFNHARVVEPYEMPEGTRVEVRLRGFSEDDVDSIFVFEQVPRRNEESEQMAATKRMEPVVCYQNDLQIVEAAKTPTMQLLVDEIRVVTIQGVRYDSSSRLVSRSRYIKDEPAGNGDNLVDS